MRKHTITFLALAIVGIITSGCDTLPTSATVSPLNTQSFEDARPPQAESLFPADQAVLSDRDVERAFATKLEFPAKARVALMKFPGSDYGERYYGSYYWRDERFLKLQQEQVDTLSQALVASDRVTEAIPLPSLMIPHQVSLPMLREAAVRMQADLLLIYRINSDTYSQYRMFAKDKVKAYSTCEVVLMDVRTGLVPFTRVTSREKVETKSAADLDFSETMRRAEQESANDALQTAANNLATFIKAMPEKGQ